MAFKLTIEIGDDGSTNVNFDGVSNHLLVLGLLESIKFNILNAAAELEQQHVAGDINESREGTGHVNT